MKRVSIYSIIFLLGGLIFSCKPSRICPAYHSAFILDPEVTRTTFSLFGPDSLPKDPETDLWMIEKKKVGIADDFAYKKKNNKMAIISMERIYLEKEDPLDMPMAMAEMDSSMVDSIRHERQSQQYDDFYNYDQLIYLHYFGDYLPKGKPSSGIADDLKKEETLIQDDTPIEDEQEKKGLFKGLFKKKNKSVNQEEDDEDYEDEEPE